jgi:methyl-accepting chemotaxis protein
VEEAAAAAASMQQQTEALTDVVSMFKLTARQHRLPSPPTRSAARSSAPSTARQMEARCLSR